MVSPGRDSVLGPETSFSYSLSPCWIPYNEISLYITLYQLPFPVACVKHTQAYKTTPAPARTIH